MIMEKQQKVLTVRVVIQLLIFVVAIPFLPLLISRRWDWWEAWEDRTLQEELQGYREYAGKVPYRLLPGIW